MKNYLIFTISKISECFFATLDSESSSFWAGDKGLNFGESLKCAEFVLAVVNRMQPVYKFGILALLFYFNFAALVSRGRIFTNLSLADRTKIIGNWSKSAFRPKRDFMKLLLNLSIIAYYDSEIVLKKNGINTDEYLKIQSLYNG